MYSMVLMAALTTGSNAPDCGLLRSFFCCHTCSGGYGCYSCSGCNGCYGGASHYSCVGGCYGSCYGGAYYSSMNCFGCYGCYGYGAGSTYAPVMPPAGPEIKDKDKEKDKDKKDKETAASAKARLIVELPADAKLYIDDQLMKTSSTKRNFSTPELRDGQSYFYDIRVEVVRDGKTYESTQRIIVRAGEQIRAAFQEAETGSTLSVKREARR
jgi:uncharacterized protein (TIGR03000 family)